MALPNSALNPVSIIHFRFHHATWSRVLAEDGFFYIEPSWWNRNALLSDEFNTAWIKHCHEFVIDLYNLGSKFALIVAVIMVVPSGGSDVYLMLGEVRSKRQLSIRKLIELNVNEDSSLKSCIYIVVKWTAIEKMSTLKSIHILVSNENAKWR